MLNTQTHKTEVTAPAETDHRNESFERCKELAQHPSILSLLDEDLRAHGFAGPTAIPQLVFLSFYTRVFDDPVSLLIKGPSGVGKSFSLNAGKQYVSEKAYEEFHGLSERALLYLEGLDLKHRFLIIQEAAGLNHGVGRVFFRQLLSEGRVNYATVQNTDQGLVGKRLPALEGPTGAMMTTTANELHIEDETRFISMHVHESPDRVKEALLKQAAGARIEVSRDLSQWHALHDFVCSGLRGVEIPFAETLANGMPTSHPRVQRDFPKLLSLIRAHALLHQCTRERDGDRVVATLDDYAAVYKLVAGPMAEALEAAVPEHIRRVVEAVEALTTKGGKREPLPFDSPGVSQREAADWLDIHASSVSRTVRLAIEQGYLADINPGQGRLSGLIVGERKLPNGR